MDKIRNEYITGSVKVATVSNKLKSRRLAWYGHVMRREKMHVTRRCMEMVVQGRGGRGRPEKTWMECVNDDMRERGVSVEMTADRREWKRKISCTDPT